MIPNFKSFKQTPVGTPHLSGIHTSLMRTMVMSMMIIMMVATMVIDNDNNDDNNNAMDML